MPKPYVRPMPATWWLRNRAYFWFMVRELTAVFVAAYCIWLLIVLWKIKSSSRGGVAYDDILAWLQTPWSVAIHFIALIAAMYHAITWFALVPKVMVVRVGEEKVPPFLLVAAHWVLWSVITLAIIWFVFRPTGSAAPPIGSVPAPRVPSSQPSDQAPDELGRSQ
jgi:succinate dehydrogenase subunit C